MENFQQIISWLVVGIGLISWIMFLPQIRLLLKAKEAKSISLGLVWGSFITQFIIFIHTILQKDWQLSFAILTSLVCLVIIICLIYYYRQWPGGRS